MTAVAPKVSFQSTDLQRHAREVLDAARAPEGAMIRDKDGTNFWLVRASRVSQDNYTLNGLSDVLRILRLALLDDSVREPGLYGDFSWLAPLPADAQQEFAWQYAHTLQAMPATGVAPVEDLLYDWQQTARAWADPALRKSLTRPLDAPLPDVEL